MQMFTIQELEDIRSDVSSISLANKLGEYIQTRKDAELRHKEEEERRSRAIPIQVPDFHHVKPGTLVVRSEHWKKETYNQDKDQIGMLTEIKIYKDDLNGFSVWPMVHWEGEMFSSINHPINVALKSGEQLPIVTINNNQQS